MADRNEILSVRGATKTYTGRPALRDVSLSIAPAEMVALIGPSGAGKSTLLRAINGLARLDRGGRVEAFGACVQENGRISRRARRLRARIGFVFQQFNLVGRLDLATNVRLGALGRTGFLRGLPGLWPASTRMAAAAAMERLGVAAQARQRARTLSGGQQQRAAIARALTQGAEVILADEPVASLDPAAAERVMAALRDLNRRDGMTVVVSLHQVELARRWYDRIVGLRDGAIVFDGPAEQLDAAGVSAIYGQPAAAAQSGAVDPTPAEGAHR